MAAVGREPMRGRRAAQPRVDRRDGRAAHRMTAKRDGIDPGGDSGGKRRSRRRRSGHISTRLSTTLTTAQTPAILTGVARVLAGEEAGGQRLDQHVGRQADGKAASVAAVAAASPGRTRRAGTAPTIIGSAITISAAAAGSVSSRANSSARFWLCMRRAVVAGAELAGEQRQQRGADGDADHAERKLVHPVGVEQVGHRSRRQPGGEHRVDHQVDLVDAGAERHRQRPADEQPLHLRASAAAAAGGASIPARPQA